MKLKHYLLIGLLGLPLFMNAQVDDDKLGAWYLYFFSADLKESQFGVMGDIQYRNFNLGGDLDQLLLRGAATYTLKDKSAKFALGYAHITNGEFGDGNSTFPESRIYQEIALPQKIADGRLQLNHRFRYEQRFVARQDFRTRIRYTLFVNIPFNSRELKKKTYYAALYNEVFINGEKNIGNGRTVELFDRNRAYIGLGYVINDKLKIQAGYMEQSTNSISKGQLQLQLNQSF